MKNYYQILGVDRTASPDQIKQAYRRLASRHHPDKGGDKNAFQEIQQAYDTLGDDQKRAQYDNPRSQFDQFGFKSDAPFDFETIFNVFGTRFTHPGQQRRQQARMSLWITLRDVAEGGKKTISVGTQAGTQAMEIEIPLSINDGDTVQYPSAGPGGLDLFVTFRIHPDPRWNRQELNLLTEHSISIWDLILGTEITITHLLGRSLTLTVPPRTQPGTMLRLKGQGLTSRQGHSGDLMIKIQALMPATISDELLEMIKNHR
jgi:curved DNA-binding protein